MNKEELFEVMEDIDAKHVKAAREKRPKKPVWKRRWVRAVAAVLVLAVAGGILLRPDHSVLVPKAYAVALAEYPEMASCPKTDLSPGYDAWREDVRAQRRPAGHAAGLEDFFAATIQKFLSGAEGENKTYSPVSVYLALGMMAELTDGNSRAQILELLGYTDMDALRRQANDIWNANYMNDGKTVSILGSSLWLNEDISFRQDTLDTLAGTYYASTYQGEMGSQKFNKTLQKWLNAHTGGQLAEQAGQVELDADTVMALATAVWYQAKWDSAFSKGNTAAGVFHGADGDVTCDFMHKEKMEGYYYWGEGFAAVSLNLENAGRMWFLLPDEGVSVDELLAGGETMEFLKVGQSWENRKYMNINLALPKFDVTSQIDLIEGLKDLGVTDVLDWRTADFTPMLEGEEEYLKYLPYLSQAQQDVRVSIDEDGVTAVAYTILSFGAGAAEPPSDEVDFIVDRPFLFVITGADDVPLFVGVVNDP